MDKYKNFWRRLIASFIDELFLIPVSYFIIYFQNNDSLLSFLVCSILYTAIYSAYFILLHGKYGQTIGKRILSIKVTTIDEVTVIGYTNAFKRDFIWLFSDLIALTYFTVLWIKNTQSKEDIISSYNDFITTSTLIWLTIEMITMFFNSKRRALHDYLGNSVVIKIVS